MDTHIAIVVLVEECEDLKEELGLIVGEVAFLQRLKKNYIKNPNKQTKTKNNKEGLGFIKGALPFLGAYKSINKLGSFDISRISHAGWF